MGFHVTVHRHGETDVNVQQAAQGSTDSNLTPNGRLQATDLGKALQYECYTRVYSSDLVRTQETVKIVLSLNRNPVPEIILDKRLRERDFGDWEGKPLAEIFKVATDAHIDPLQLVPPSGETSMDAYIRMVEFIEELINEVDTSDKYENVLVSTHGVAIQGLLKYFAVHKYMYDLGHFTYDQYEMPCNTAVTKFFIDTKDSGEDGRRRIKFDCVYDRSHLTTPVGSDSQEITARARAADES